MPPHPALPPASAPAVVLRLAAAVTALSAAVVVGAGTLLWRLEGDRAGSTVRTWSDGLWWALTTLTTVGYGDHVPVSGPGRLVAAAVMVAGVAVVGAVAGVVALAIARAVAAQEERTLEADAASLEARLERRLDDVEAALRRVEALLSEREHR